MTTEHTPEPLRIAAGDPTFITVPHVAKPINCGSQALARRIVACVNACASLTTLLLENAAPDGVGRAFEKFDALKQQRDALAEALRKIADVSEEFAGSEPDMPSHLNTAERFDAALNSARAALARLA